MRLYGSVEEVVTLCLVYRIWRLLCSYSFLTASTPPPPPPPPPPPQFFFFPWIWILCQNSLTRELKIPPPPPPPPGFGFFVKNSHTRELKIIFVGLVL